ncbi:MAG: hypothetical protein AAGA58_06375 [Verrucomicrobiota bacterium]
MMTRSVLFIVSFGLLLPLIHADECPIPIDDLFVSVDIEEGRNRPEGLSGFRVYASMHRDKGSPKGGTSLGVDCREFSSGMLMLPPEDRAMFFRTAAAARESRELIDHTITRTYYGPKKTEFESFQRGDTWLVRVTRAEKEAIFSPDEEFRLKAALKEAIVAQIWFRKLLFHEKTPETSPDSRPPVAEEFDVSSSLGTVSGGDLSFDINLFSIGAWAPEKFTVKHWIKYDTNDALRGSSSGQWVEELLDRIREAIAAAETGEVFEFKSNRDEDDCRYTVTADLKTKEAIVVVTPGAFFKDRSDLRGQFGKEEMDLIQGFVAAAPKREEWFNENESLFITKEKK